MKNGEAKEQLIVLYGCRCMLTNIKGKQGLTYHHLLKKVNGGKATVENGANLQHLIHQWLHNEIETNDIQLFHLINECLQLYKKCIDEQQTELIEQYENEIMPLFYKKYEAYQREQGKAKRRR